MFLRRTTVLAVAFLLAAFAPFAGVHAASDAPANVTLAYQPGIGYANLIVLKQSGALEKRFPNTHFDWHVLASGAAIRDGILAGQIQIGAGGAGPFLIGWDRGVGYKLIAALNEMSLWLVTRDPKVHSLKELSPSARIGLPAPDSIQAVVLRKASETQLGNAHAFDASLVAIEHPLGVAALAGGQLDAHLSAPPFQQEEVDAGGHVILKSFDVFGRSSFNMVYTTDAFAAQYPGFVAEFYRQLRAATDVVAKDPARAAADLAKDAGAQTNAATFRRWLSAPDIAYTTVPHGMLKVARFMKSIGLLTRAPGNIRDLELTTISGQGD